MLRPILLILLALFSFSALASWRDDAPTVLEPFDGIVARASLKPNNTQTIDGLENKRVAVILSNNTHSHLKWSDQVNKDGVGGFDSFFSSKEAVDHMNRGLEEAFRPASITAAALKPLVERAKEVKIMNDLVEFRESGFELAAIIDITFSNTFFDSPIFIGSKYESGTSLKVFFVNQALSLGPIVEVGKLQSVDRQTFENEIARLRAEVFQEYNTAMAKTLGSAKAKSKTQTSAASRLTEVDALRKKGLISETEAAEKRKKILDGM